MFIKRLWGYNKILCGFFTAFIISFIVINYKWGVVATPVQQYGMYSTVFYRADTQTVYMIEADDKMINCAGISLTERDILQIYPEDYEKQKPVNDAAYQTMRNYIKYTGLLRYMQYDKYSNRIGDKIFTDWYKVQVEKIIKSPVKTLKVYKQHFQWKLNKLEPVDTLTKLTYLGT